MNRTLAALAAISILALAGCSSSSTDPKAAPSSSAPGSSATFTLPADGPSQLAPQKNRDAAAAILRASTQHYRELLAEGQTSWGTPAFGPWSQKAMKDLSDMAAFTKADKQFTADNEPASISDWRDDMGTVESAINEWAAKNTLETSDKASMPPATEVSKALAAADADIAKVVAGK